MPNQFRLTELLDIGQLQTLQDNFANMAGVTAVFIGPGGKALTNPSNLCGFCETMQSNPVGHRMCMGENSRRSKKNAASGEPLVGSCPYSGLATLSVPIFTGGIHLGSWVVTQLRVREPAPGLLEKTAGDTGVGLLILQQAVEGLPVRGQEEFDSIYDFLLSLCSVVGRLADAGMANLSREQERRAELAELAYFDRQMGLPNSAKLIQDIEEARKTNHARQHLVCFDILMMRHLNEAYGREMIDELLASIVAWLREAYPEAGVYRLGGDEFCLRLAGTTQQKAEQAAWKVFGRFDESWPVELGGQQVSVLCGASVSLIAVNSDVGQGNILDLIDRTLDASRLEGKPIVHSKEMDKAAKDHAKLETELKACVKNNMQGFEIYYQPIVDPAAGRWAGLEALCRWNSPALGNVPSDVFIKEAEQMGLIRSMGQWVLEGAVRQCKQWGLDRIDQFFLSVNLSPLQVMDESLTMQVVQLLRKYQYPFDKLNLEVTESGEINFNLLNMNVIENLRFRGVNIALDDFGSGYSSFNNLKNLPVSFLKTEQSFIQGIEDDEYMQYYFYIMAELTHATDMKLITEGVETRKQLEILLRNGVDYVQGYYFSKPLPAHELEKRLDQFVKVDSSFYVISSAPINRDQIEGRETYRFTPTLFKLLDECIQMLLASGDPRAALPTVLQRAGGYFGVSYSYLYVKNEAGGFVNTHEWCARGEAPRKQSRRPVTMEQLGPMWFDMLGEEGMIVASDVSRLPEPIYLQLAARGILATAVLPILDGEEIIGFLGLDDLHHYRNWLPEEAMMLRNLCMVVSGSLKRVSLEKQLVQKNMIFSDVLNHMDLIINVTDIDTHEVLWSNDTARQVHYGIELVGAKCYNVLQGQQKACTFCKVPTLLANPEVKQCAWEHVNPANGRIYTVYDSLVYWEGGKKVHLEYALDVTDTRKAQQQLEYYATTDSLTGTVNRNTLMQILGHELEVADNRGRPLAIAFADIDKLKPANDTYGHSFGDMLINNTVKALRTVLGEDDVLGRLGGDEFIAILPGKTAARAEEMIMEARDILQKMDFDGVKNDFSFSFGVVENKELPYAAGEGHLTEILDIADVRMRAFKNATVPGRHRR